jgi:hypothetical protein
VASVSYGVMPLFTLAGSSGIRVLWSYAPVYFNWKQWHPCPMDTFLHFCCWSDFIEEQFNALFAKCLSNTYNAIVLTIPTQIAYFDDVEMDIPVTSSVTLINYIEVQSPTRNWEEEEKSSNILYIPTHFIGLLVCKIRLAFTINCCM